MTIVSSWNNGNNSLRGVGEVGAVYLSISLNNKIFLYLFYLLHVCFCVLNE